MKKSFSIFFLCATASIAHAQSPIKAGTVALGGSINYSHSGNEVSSNTGYRNGSYSSSTSNNTLSLSPEASYFVVDNLSVGLSLNYSIQELSFSSSPNSSSGNNYRGDATSFRVGPFVRYYKMLTDQFGFTGTLGAGYEHDKQPGQTNNSVALKANGFYTALTPGVIFLPIPKLGIGASIGGLGYTRLDVKPETSTTNTNSSYTQTDSTFGASFGLAQLTFSGTYFFGR